MNKTLLIHQFDNRILKKVEILAFFIELCKSKTFIKK